MKLVRKRLTYANLMSSIAVFLVLGGATAFAAGHLGKNTVGSKQLKKEAVTAAKIKKGAVTAAQIKAGAITGSQLGDGSVTEGKLANGAVGGSKLGDGSVTEGKLANGAVGTSKIAPGAVTGAQINAPSTPFSQVADRIRNGSVFGLQTTGQFVPIGSYTQPAGEDDWFFGGVDVTFAPSCVAPRSATAILVVDPTNLTTLTSVSEIAGYGVIEDKGTGQVEKRLEFGFYPGVGASLGRMGPNTATPHSFYLYTAGATCTSGSGITGTNAGVDVIGTK
jgi:hypothetical protein